MVATSRRTPRLNAAPRVMSIIEFSGKESRVRRRGRYDRLRMGERVEGYRSELRRLKDWDPFLKKHSGLPGPRANLELVAAVVEEGDADRLWRLSATDAVMGSACFGRRSVTGGASPPRPRRKTRNPTSRSGCARPTRTSRG